MSEDTNATVSDGTNAGPHADEVKMQPEAGAGGQERTELPADIADDERRDYELTGKLELYELRRAADKLKLRREAEEIEAQKKALREKIAKEKEATEKPTGELLVCPADATDLEKKDFERTGTLELYELNREADKIQRERIKLRQEAAEIATLEAHKRALRAQAEMDRLTLENERKALAAPPPVYEEGKPIPGSERLPDVVKGVIRRLFGYGSGEWTEANQIGLVNLLLSMGNHKAQMWAYEMRDALASDVYGSHDLSPRAILKGSTGLKAIAGPALMGELKALAGGDTHLKALADEQRPRKKKKRSKRRDGVIEVEATRIEPTPRKSRHVDDDDSDEDVIDDAPNQEIESIHDPWGEFD